MYFKLSKSFLSFYKFVVVSAALILLTGVFSCSNKNADQKPVDSGFKIEKPNVIASVPFVVSKRPSDREMCKNIGDEIDSRGQRAERWGVVVMSLKDGRIICGRNERKLFAPASVLKLFTAAAALEKLGPESRSKTSVYVAQNLKNGTVNGDLVLYGRGAPDFGHDSMNALITDLKKKGIKRIEGDIVGDESYFKGDALGDGWLWNETLWYYGAAASALSYERNQIDISIQNGKPQTGADFVELSGELKPVKKIEAIGINRKLGTNRVYVWGNGKNMKFRIAVLDPALFTARVFREQLEKHGISVSGNVRSVDWTRRSETSEMKELAFVESEPVSETVRKMNKDSVNLFAELLLRQIGHRFGSEAPDKNKKLNKLRGDDGAGTSVVKNVQPESGFDISGLAIHDGSGLSTLNRVTPESVVRTLVFAADGKNSNYFLDSLPVAGKDGTLRGRLTGFSGKVAAKTGSIRYVNSLAGFANTPDETLAFAIICNDETNRSDSSSTIDRIVGLLFGSEVE